MIIKKQSFFTLCCILFNGGYALHAAQAPEDCPVSAGFQHCTNKNCDMQNISLNSHPRCQLYGSKTEKAMSISEVDADYGHTDNCRHGNTFIQGWKLCPTCGGDDKYASKYNQKQPANHTIQKPLQAPAIKEKKPKERDKVDKIMSYWVREAFSQNSKRYVPADLIDVVYKFSKTFYQLDRVCTIPFQSGYRYGDTLDIQLLGTKHLVTGTLGTESSIIDIETGNVKLLPKSNSIQRKIATSYNKGLIVSKGCNTFKGTNLDIYDIKNASRKLLVERSPIPNAIVLSEDGELLAVATNDFIKLWSYDSESNFFRPLKTSKNQNLEIPNETRGAIFSDVLIHKKEHLYILNYVGTSNPPQHQILHYDLTNDKQNVYCQIGNGCRVTNFLLNPVQEKLFVSLTNDKQENQATIGMFDLKQHADHADQFTATTSLTNSDISLAISLDGKILASYDHQSTINLYNPEDLTLTQSLEYKTDISHPTSLDNRLYITLCAGVYYVACGYVGADPQIDILKLK